MGLLQCDCCGETARTWIDRKLGRCFRHQGRNPCAIEGCKRTTKAPDDRYSTEDWICGTHWRQFVPPGSQMRRVYHRLWRLKKKRGEWTPDLTARFWRVWRRIVATARAASRGDVDMTEVNKLFGWE